MKKSSNTSQISGRSQKKTAQVASSGLFTHGGHDRHLHSALSRVGSIDRSTHFGGRSYDSNYRRGTSRSAAAGHLDTSQMIVDDGEEEEEEEEGMFDVLDQETKFRESLSFKDRFWYWSGVTSCWPGSLARKFGERMYRETRQRWEERVKMLESEHATSLRRAHLICLEVDKAEALFIQEGQRQKGKPQKNLRSLKNLQRNFMQVKREWMVVDSHIDFTLKRISRLKLQIQRIDALELDQVDNMADLRSKWEIVKRTKFSSHLMNAKEDAGKIVDEILDADGGIGMPNPDEMIRNQRLEMASMSDMVNMSDQDASDFQYLRDLYKEEVGEEYPLYLNEIANGTTASRRGGVKKSISLSKALSKSERFFNDEEDDDDEEEEEEEEEIPLVEQQTTAAA